MLAGIGSLVQLACYVVMGQHVGNAQMPGGNQLALLICRDSFVDKQVYEVCGSLALLPRWRAAAVCVVQCAIIRQDGGTAAAIMEARRPCFHQQSVVLDYEVLPVVLCFDLLPLVGEAGRAVAGAAYHGDVHPSASDIEASNARWCESWSSILVKIVLQLRMLALSDCLDTEYLREAKADELRPSLRATATWCRATLVGLPSQGAVRLHLTVTRKTSNNFPE